MELNIEWTRVEDVKMSQLGRFYFVANIHEYGLIREFCIAYKVLEVWKSSKNTTVPFEVTHVSSIREVTHKILPSAYAIGDEVEILTSVDDYDTHSIGRIVGKYDKPYTWAVRMEDRFVILLEDKLFKHF